MARLCTLASGSAGNSTYIGSADCGILIDAAPSTKAILTALCENGIQKESIKAIFLTHAHEDHIAALKVLVKKIDAPIFASKETAEFIMENPRFDGIEIKTMEKELSVGEMTVSRFATMHDSPGSSGYRVSFADGTEVGLCTDLGIVTDEVKNGLCGCKAVVLESNHDVLMLQNGPYPYPLKQRISGDLGHLSNGNAAALAAFLVENGTKHLVLAHLSRENNTPEIAKRTIKSGLMSAGFNEDVDYTLAVAPIGCGRVIVC